MILKEQDLLARFSITYCCKDDELLTLVGDTSGVARLFGYTTEELSALFGNSLAAMVCASERQGLLGDFDHDVIECVLPLRHKDGHNVWVLTKGIQQAEADGNS